MWVIFFNLYEELFHSRLTNNKLINNNNDTFYLQLADHMKCSCSGTEAWNAWKHDTDLESTFVQGILCISQLHSFQ